MTKLAADMMKIFAGHSGAYGTHGEPYQEPGKLKWEIKKTAKTIRDPVTEELWDMHLSGTQPLGVISIKEDSTCSWGSIDIDKYDHDLLEIVAKVEKSKFPLIPCMSKSGGLHLFLFLEEPQAAGAVQSVLRDMAASLGLAGSEIFPKQTQVLAERGDLGSWMVMPYFGSNYKGKLKDQFGLKKTGALMSITEFIKTVQKMLVSNEDFLRIGTRKKANGKFPNTTFNDGPPCLQHLAEIGFPDGMRNNALFHMGVYFRKKEPGNWKAALEEANRQLMRPPLTTEEMQSTIRSLDKKEYEYTCKVEPMCSHCDSMLCRTRKFGVGDAGNIPMISGLSKLDTRPAIWFVDVANTRLEISTEQLQNYQLFQRVCIEEADHVFGTIKQSVWLSILNEAMQNLIRIEAPPDIGIQGKFQELLEEFLTNRQAGERIDDLLHDRPWEDEEKKKFFFKLSALHKFLDREDFTDESGRRVKRNKLSRYIQKMGGGGSKLWVRHKTLAVWWVPSDIIQRTPSVEPPPVPGIPI